MAKCLPPASGASLNRRAGAGRITSKARNRAALCWTCTFTIRTLSSSAFGRPSRSFRRGLSKFSGAIDHVVTQYQFDSGVLVSAEGSWLVTPGGGFNMAYTVHFENAMVDYDFARGADALKCSSLAKTESHQMQGPGRLPCSSCSTW